MFILFHILGIIIPIDQPESFAPNSGSTDPTDPRQQLAGTALSFHLRFPSDPPVEPRKTQKRDAEKMQIM